MNEGQGPNDWSKSAIESKFPQEAEIRDEVGAQLIRRHQHADRNSKVER